MVGGDQGGAIDGTQIRSHVNQDDVGRASARGAHYDLAVIYAHPIRAGEIIDEKGQWVKV